jgi:deoxyribonuclease-4
MLPSSRRIGVHLPLGAGMVKAADRAVAIGATTIQVFTDNPTSWRRRPTLPVELPAFRERLLAADISPVAVHAPYLVNLAGPEAAFHEQSIAVLANELRVGRAYGAAFVNVHIGSHRGEGVGAGLDRLTAGIVATLARADEDGADDAAAGEIAIALENGSGGGFGMGTTVEELAEINHAARGAGVPAARLCFCLDAAHLWGAGYAIDTAAGVDDVLEAFDEAIGLDRLVMVHLNDSRSERGSRADRHEHVGAGRIGGEGLARLLAHPKLAHVAYILETPGMDEAYDAINLARARALAAGQPLEELPAAAFQLRSSRGRSAPPDPDATGSHDRRSRRRRSDPPPTAEPAT